MIGYGESAALSEPLFNCETIDTSMHILQDFLAPAVIGKHLKTIDDFSSALPRLYGNRTARTGIENAFWHLLSQYDGKPLSKLIGGVHAEIPVGESIGIKSTLQELLQETEQRLREGYLRIKIKIMPGWDQEPLAAIRRTWPDILLTADANASYSLPEHERDLRALDQFNLAMLEQPLAAHDFTGHASLQKLLHTPICLDESIESLDDLRTSNALGSAKIVNLKPMRVGGLQECLKLYHFAAVHNLAVWCGGMLETGIGRAFNIALASKERFHLPADMSPYQLFFAEDLVEDSFVVKPNGHIDVPTTPGLGYCVSEEQIKKFTTQKIVITA
jgi:O-succinylbenzoate synthase